MDMVRISISMRNAGTEVLALIIKPATFCKLLNAGVKNFCKMDKEMKEKFKKKLR